MEDTKKTKPVYSKQFKQDAVELVSLSGRPVSAIARDLGISESALRNWIKAQRPEQDTNPKVLSKVSLLEQELKKQAQVIKELKMEREILKRFSAFWVKEISEN